MLIFDSHAHYNDEKFELDREETLQKVLDAGVKNLICAGYSVESSRQAIKIANEHRYIYATAGISPNDIPTFENENTDVRLFATILFHSSIDISLSSPMWEIPALFISTFMWPNLSRVSSTIWAAKE